MTLHPDDDPNEYLEDVTERYIAIPGPEVKILFGIFVAILVIIIVLAATGVL